MTAKIVVLVGGLCALSAALAGLGISAMRSIGHATEDVERSSREARQASRTSIALLD